ncbi:hypothetical protein ACI0FM_07880 [Paenochrobactrum sp. BZR 588]|uniref:hypothetical protein n=1 Tax=unclassified Paenochrobactrum TaxID=2639760 RepID=UPI0038519F54
MQVKFFDTDNFDHGGLATLNLDYLPLVGDLIELNESYFRVVKRLLQIDNGDMCAWIDVAKVDDLYGEVSFYNAITV